MPDTRTKAQRNRAIRQEALREQLANGGHLQHVIEMAEKISDVDHEIDPAMVHRLKIAIETKLKLVDKYLPNLKAVEITGDPDNPVAVTRIELVAVNADSTG